MNITFSKWSILTGALLLLAAFLWWPFILPTLICLELALAILYWAFDDDGNATLLVISVAVAIIGIAFLFR
jgi:hypothetical protein